MKQLARQTSLFRSPRGKKVFSYQTRAGQLHVRWGACLASCARGRMLAASKCLSASRRPEAESKHRLRFIARQARRLPLKTPWTFQVLSFVLL